MVSQKTGRGVRLQKEGLYNDTKTYKCFLKKQLKKDWPLNLLTKQSSCDKQ